MPSPDMPRQSESDMSPRREAAATQAYKLLTKAEEQLDLIGPIPHDIEVPRIVGKIRKRLETLHERFMPRKEIRLESSHAKEKRVRSNKIKLTVLTSGCNPKPKRATRDGREVFKLQSGYSLAIR